VSGILLKAEKYSRKMFPLHDLSNPHLATKPCSKSLLREGGEGRTPWSVAAEQDIRTGKRSVSSFFSTRKITSTREKCASKKRKGEKNAPEKKPRGVKV